MTCYWPTDCLSVCSILIGQSFVLLQSYWSFFLFASTLLVRLFICSNPVGHSFDLLHSYWSVCLFALIVLVSLFICSNAIGQSVHLLSSYWSVNLLSVERVLAAPAILGAPVCVHLYQLVLRAEWAPLQAGQLRRKVHLQHSGVRLYHSGASYLMGGGGVSRPNVSLENAIECKI